MRTGWTPAPGHSTTSAPLHRPLLSTGQSTVCGCRDLSVIHTALSTHHPRCVEKSVDNSSCGRHVDDAVEPVIPNTCGQLWKSTVHRWTGGDGLVDGTGRHTDDQQDGSRDPRLVHVSPTAPKEPLTCTVAALSTGSTPPTTLMRSLNHWSCPDDLPVDRAPGSPARASTTPPRMTKSDSRAVAHLRALVSCLPCALRSHHATFAQAPARPTNTTRVVPKRVRAVRSVSREVPRRA